MEEKDAKNTNRFLNSMSAQDFFMEENSEGRMHPWVHKGCPCSEAGTDPQ